MLNQTLKKETFRKIISLRNNNEEAFNAIKALLNAELEHAKNTLIDENEPSAMYRAQGACLQLTELITLFEQPQQFKEMFNE